MSMIKITADIIDSALATSGFHDIAPFWDNEEQTPYEYHDFPSEGNEFITAIVGHIDGGTSALIEVAENAEPKIWANKEFFNPTSPTDASALIAEFAEQCWSEISTAISDLHFAMHQA